MPLLLRPQSQSAGKASQELYDYVVSPTGGDFATLSEALAVATAGQSIFVKTGDYAEAGGSFSTARLTIRGENWRETILTLSAPLTLSGSTVSIENLHIIASGQGFTMSGAYNTVRHCYFVANTNTITLNGSASLVADSFFTNNYANGYMSVSGNYKRVLDCTFEGACSNYLLRSTANRAVISGNSFQGGGGGGYCLSNAGDNVTVSSNSLNPGTGNYGIHSTGGRCVISGNAIGYAKYAIQINGDSAVTGNSIGEIETNGYGISAGANSTVSGNNISSPNAYSGTRGILATGTQLNINGNSVRQVATGIDLANFTNVMVTSNITSLTPTAAIANAAGAGVVNANNLQGA